MFIAMNRFRVTKGRSSSGRNLIHFNPNEISLISIKKSRIARMESKAVPCNEGLANKRLWLIAGSLLRRA